MLGRPGIRIPITVPIRRVIFEDTGEPVVGVGEKLRGSGLGLRRFPFVREGAPIVPGRVLNYLQRHMALYMRYE